LTTGTHYWTFRLHFIQGNHGFEIILYISKPLITLQSFLFHTFTVITLLVLLLLQKFMATNI